MSLRFLPFSYAPGSCTCTPPRADSFLLAKASGEGHKTLNNREDLARESLAAEKICKNSRVVRGNSPKVGQMGGQRRYSNEKKSFALVNSTHPSQRQQWQGETPYSLRQVDTDSGYYSASAILRVGAQVFR